MNKFKTLLLGFLGILIVTLLGVWAYSWWTRPPEVMSIYPTTPEIETNDAIWIEFNEQILEKSIENVTITPTNKGNISLSEDKKTILYTPVDPLENDTEYSFVFKTISNTKGGKINNLEVSFLVTPSLRIVSTFPENGATQISPHPTISFSFNKPIDPYQFDFQIQPTAPFELQETTLGTYQLTYKLEDMNTYLDENTPYLLTLSPRESIQSEIDPITIEFFTRNQNEIESEVINTVTNSTEFEETINTVIDENPYLSLINTLPFTNEIFTLDYLVNEGTFVAFFKSQDAEIGTKSVQGYIQSFGVDPNSLTISYIPL